MHNNRLIITFTLLWELYYLQGALEFTGLLSQILLTILFTISGFYCYKVNVKKVYNSGIKAINILLILVIFYGLFLIASGENTTVYRRAYMVFSRFSYLKAFLLSLLPVYFYYYYSLKNELSPNTIKFLLLSLIVTYIVSFYSNLYRITEGETEEEIVNNVGYYFLSIFPMIYLLKEKLLLKVITVGIVSFYILMSLKRGAIITGGICLLFFLYNSFKNSNQRNKFFVIILSVLLVYLMYRYVIDFYNSSEFFQHRYEQTLEGESSGRDSIFSTLINGFLAQNSIISIVLGNGANATLRLYGHLAHNDWLEFLTNQGILGVVVYAIYWIRMFTVRKKLKGEVSLCFRTFLLIYFTISFFSMSANDYSTCASLCLGYCLARSNDNIH